MGRESVSVRQESCPAHAQFACATAQAAYAVAAVKLLVFTGARLGEVLALRWEWIDFERGEARLPDSKTGAKTLHLPPPALAYLHRDFLTPGTAVSVDGAEAVVTALPFVR